MFRMSPNAAAFLFISNRNTEIQSVLQIRSKVPSSTIFKIFLGPQYGYWILECVFWIWGQTAALNNSRNTNLMIHILQSLAPCLVKSVTGFSDHTTYLDVRELAQVSVHGDESMIDQLLVVISPQLITVLQHAITKKAKIGSS